MRIERKRFLELCVGSIAGLLVPEIFGVQASPEPSPSPEAADKNLVEYLESINTEQEELLKIVESRDLFIGFKDGLTRKQQVDDFKMYFPLYKAAEIKYGVPWYLLWIIHVQETTVSTDQDTENTLSTGAMQRARSVKKYSPQYIQEAVSGFEYFKHYEQRLNKLKGSPTSDYEEIFFAARKIKEDEEMVAKRRPDIGIEEGILIAQYYYCAKEYVAPRVSMYWQLKNILHNDLRFTPFARGSRPLSLNDLPKPRRLALQEM